MRYSTSRNIRNTICSLLSLCVLGTTLGRAAEKTQRPTVAADTKFVGTFLDTHCAKCHDADTKSGEFSLDTLGKDDVASRVAYASVFERLRAGDMPPPAKKVRPDAAEVAGVTKWIEAKLDAPLAGKPAYFAVKDKPVDGNRLPNAIVFGGPRGPSVPPPPRLWRLSPAAYTKLLNGFKNIKTESRQQPFGVIQDSGFRDFSALYAPDEGASSLLLINAELIVAAQAREAKNGKGVFTPVLNPTGKPRKEDLEKVIRQQYMDAIARPPSNTELERLIEFYNDLAQGGDLPLAGKTVLMVPLMAPEAVLRFEVGLGAEVRPGVRMLSPRETALSLSLTISSTRDPSLLAAATQGKLTTRKEVAESVQRILDDPKIGKSRILVFFREYFDYYRAPEVFKDPLPKNLEQPGNSFDAKRYVTETDILVLSILSHDKDILKELLTSSVSFRNGKLDVTSLLKDNIRIGSPAFSPIFSPLPETLKEKQSEKQGGHIGILMEPSWLVAWSTNFHNDIVRRGRFVRERLLGGRVPDLPIDVDAMVPDDPHHTLRERQMVTRAGACWKCHYKMDELGLPFEDVDHYGRPRLAEEVLDLEATAKSKDKKAKIYRNVPLDTTGLIAYSGDPKLDGPVKNAPEMLRQLAASDRVRQVFIRHAFRYFLGRNETPGDAVTLQEADKAYLESGGSFKALLVSLLSSESFLYRSVPTATAPSK